MDLKAIAEALKHYDEVKGTIPALEATIASLVSGKEKATAEYNRIAEKVEAVKKIEADTMLAIAKRKDEVNKEIEARLTQVKAVEESISAAKAEASKLLADLKGKALALDTLRAEYAGKMERLTQKLEMVKNLATALLV